MAVDFVYGNLPIQPNAGRTNPLEGRVWDANGSDGPEDAPGPAPTGSPTLDPDLDNHNVALDGYNGYPENKPKNLVPDVVGKTINIAVFELQRAGFKVGDISSDAQGEWQADPVVTSQTVAAGTMADLGTSVDLSTKPVEEEADPDPEPDPDPDPEPEG